MAGWLSRDSTESHQSETSHTMPLVRLDKVSLNFGTHILLDEVDFTLKKGSKIGLLGRNGAGKTTFMKVIAGAMLPDSGERWLMSNRFTTWWRVAWPRSENSSSSTTI